jgi:undecaprenyl-diphosphatase
MLNDRHGVAGFKLIPDCTSEIVSMNWLRDFDDSVLAWFRQFWGWRPRDEFMFDVTTLGGTYVLIMLLVFSVGLLLVLGRRRTALFVLAVIVGGELLVGGIKHFVHRQRPSEENMHPLVRYRPTSWSFPSGHSTGAAITYLTLAFVAATPLTGHRGRVYIVTCALLLVFLIGVSRAYFNVHYPTDVLAGWSLGLLWALGCRWVEDRWRPLRQEEAKAE